MNQKILIFISYLSLSNGVSLNTDTGRSPAILPGLSFVNNRDDSIRFSSNVQPLPLFFRSQDAPNPIVINFDNSDPINENPVSNNSPDTTASNINSEEKDTIHIPIMFGENNGKPTGVTEKNEGSGGLEGSISAFIFPTLRPKSSVITESPLNNPTESAFTVDFRNVDNCSLALGMIKYEDKCERLLARSACAEGEWLVLSESEKEAICQKRPCPFGSVFYKNECINLNTFEACPAGQILFVDYKGNAECDCEVNFHYMPWFGECVPEHEKGQCNFGEYIELSKITGQIECVTNPCVMPGYIMNNKTGSCYKKLYKGICSGSVQFTEKERTAECLNFQGNNIFEVPTLRSCPPGSRRDFLKNCRKSFRVPTRHSTSSFFGRCPKGYVKRPRGGCKKLTSLFG